MPFKGNNTKSKPKIKPKNILHRLIARCFKGSPVKGEEDEFHGSRSEEKKKLRLPWFDWLMFKKKKKKKKNTIPFDLQNVSSSSSLLSASSNGVSTPKARNSKRWCKRKQKTPSEPPSGQNITESTTTTSINSTNQTTFQSGPVNNPAQSASRTNRPGLIRRAIHRTTSNHNMARTARLKLGAGLWVMATSLGVLLVLGRAGAVLFLCSCWYVVPMVMEGD